MGREREVFQIGGRRVRVCQECALCIAVHGEEGAVNAGGGIMSEWGDGYVRVGGRWVHQRVRRGKCQNENICCEEGELDVRAGN